MSKRKPKKPPVVLVDANRILETFRWLIDSHERLATIARDPARATQHRLEARLWEYVAWRTRRVLELSLPVARFQEYPPEVRIWLRTHDRRPNLRIPALTSKKRMRQSMP